jgi:hypothetical protein
MQHNGWDHALKVTADGAGLVGHAGAVLLRKAADQAGLTAQLCSALRRKGASPLLDRGLVLVSMAAAIALGATSMSHIALLVHLAPVLGGAPSGPTVRRAPLPLPEFDVSDMEYFIAQAQIILPVLGVNILRSAATAAATGPDATSAAARASSPVFALHLKKDGIAARAREIDGEFTVLEGSAARPAWTGSAHAYQTLHQKLVQDGTLIPEPASTAMRFARDQVFASPSAAAAVVAGRQANGRVDWKIEGSGTSFGTWQDQGIDQAAGEGSA